MGSDSMSAADRIYDPAEGPAASAPKESHLVSANGELGTTDEQTPVSFPIDCLPPAAVEMARAVCVTERVPESLAGCCVLAILSASIGHGLEVRSGPDRLARANLFIVPGAESASGKSETLRHIEKPFRQFERERIKKWSEETQPAMKTEIELLGAELSELKKKLAKMESGIERDEIREDFKIRQARLQKAEEAMQQPVLTVEDSTTEKLAFLLSKNRGCITSISADAGVIVNNLLGRYSKLDRTDEAIYLKGWNWRVSSRRSYRPRQHCADTAVDIRSLARATGQNRNLVGNSSLSRRRIVTATLDLPDRMQATPDC